MVVLEDKIFVYGFQSHKLIESFDTCLNPRGICAVSGSKDVCVFASPHVKIGSIKLTHFDKGGRTLFIDSHETMISALALNHDGTLLATSSI